MAKYVSKYTGPQIDEAIGMVGQLSEENAAIRDELASLSNEQNGVDIFDESSIITGCLLSNGYGDTSQADKFHTDYIDVTNYKKITVVYGGPWITSTWQHCFYTAVNTVLSAVSVNSETGEVTFDVPDGAKLFRASGLKSFLGSYQIKAIPRASDLTQKVEANTALILKNASIMRQAVSDNSIFSAGNTSPGMLLSNGYTDKNATTGFYTQYLDLTNIERIGVYYGQPWSTPYYYHCFYEKQNALVSAVSVTSADGWVEMDVPEGATLARFSGLTAFGSDFAIYPKYKNPHIANKVDINAVNIDTNSAVTQIKRKNAAWDAPILSLLHFSDSHEGEGNLRRIAEYYNAHKQYIDDVLCTGDIMALAHTSNFNVWTDNPIVDKVLLTLGNHDQCSGSGDNAYNDRALSMADAYTKYIEPYVDTWGATCDAGKTYWYKDYAESKIRLIGLTPNLSNVTEDELAAQNAWLADTLNGAKTLGYAVVIANHYPPTNAEKIDTNFTAKNKNVPTGEYNTMSDTILGTVQNFIDGGGHFACHICGHTHCDFVTHHAEYPDQLFVVVTCANYLSAGEEGDQNRITGERSQDAFNVVGIDTASKTVKIVRIGADRDYNFRHRGTLVLNYDASPATVVYQD